MENCDIYDFLPDSNIKLKQRSDMFRINTDTTFLSRFMQVRKHDRILDVGTNNGALLLSAAQQTDGQCVGIDILPEAIELATQNALINDLNHVVFQVCALQKYNDRLFDMILCNPPYFESTEEQFSENPYLAAARHEKFLTLPELAEHSYRLLKDNGRLVVVYRADRFIEAINALVVKKMQPKRIQFIYHSLNKKATGVLIEARKNGKFGCDIEAPGILSK